jgi:hypothetical protein
MSVAITVSASSPAGAAQHEKTTDTIVMDVTPGRSVALDVDRA